MFKVFTALFLVLSSSQLLSSDMKNEVDERKSELIQRLSEAFADLPEAEREATIAFYSLDWKEVGDYKLDQSNSTLSLPEGFRLVLGKDANKARELDASEPEDPNLEAVVYHVDTGDFILFENYKDGYISLDDWKNLDSKSLLKAISENTEAANEERKRSGLGELHVVGWVQEPRLDRHSNTVYWSIEVDADQGVSSVNSIALRLGREGFEKLNWVTLKETYVPFGGHLDAMLQAHRFDPGYGYNDYTSGDKLAGYGIATLVAATVGGKMLKAGGFAIILKKLAGFAIAGAAALLYKLKNVFKRGKKEAHA